MEIIVIGCVVLVFLVCEVDFYFEMWVYCCLGMNDNWVVFFNVSSGIEIYIGEGKGKLISVLGKVLQVIGWGISQDKSYWVLILQWFKGGSGYIEDVVIVVLCESYFYLVDYFCFGCDVIVWWGQQELIDYVEVEWVWEIVWVVILSGFYKIVIFDELNFIVDLELLFVELIL